MPQTKVNLRHLLEDIRDSYPCREEKAIITELVANSLDSGATEIRFQLDRDQRVVTVVDNGQAMSQRNFSAYHDIASTTKQRGKGIGFAGVGVKLALLQAEKVVTETKSRRFHKATTWRLRSASSAPWRFVVPQGKVRTPSGTAISIHLDTKDGAMLDEGFVEDVIRDEFYPILHEQFMAAVLRDVYWNGVGFYVNDHRVALPESGERGSCFVLRIGRRRKIAGYGLIQRFDEPLPEDKRGIAISTFGKVIKRGWDWIDIMPLNPSRISGVVEVPDLSRIITTNKMDFLKDAGSLQKYYRYRKVIQHAVKPVLGELGEIPASTGKLQADFRPIERRIEEALRNLLGQFPELNPLLGRKKAAASSTNAVPDPDGPPVGVEVIGPQPPAGESRGPGGEGEGRQGEAAGGLFGRHIEPSTTPNKVGRLQQGRKRGPGLAIAFESNPLSDQLGRLNEDTVFVNTNHPAFSKVQGSPGAQSYHIALTVAWVLSNYLEGEKSVQLFISSFMANWAGRSQLAQAVSTAPGRG